MGPPVWRDTPISLSADIEKQSKDMNMYRSNSLLHRFSTYVVVLVVLVSALSSAWYPAVAWQTEPSQLTPATSPVDLATVPLQSADFPEQGYQLAQAGDLELNAFNDAWSGEDNGDEWDSIADGYQSGYSTVHVLLGDRGDSRSEPLASVTTYVVGFDSSALAGGAGQILLDIAGYGPTQDMDGASVYVDVTGVLGFQAFGDYLVMVQYASAEQQFADRQNTEDWTPESSAELVQATGDRLGVALDRAEDGEESLGVANVMFYGPDAGWTMPWIYYPSTEHYRVLDGEVVAYGGELDSDLADLALPGMDDLFVSRQQVGQEGYEHLIDITLARFDSEEAAAEFADDPLPISFPPTWHFDVDYSGSNALDDGVRLERARTDGDELRASGYRTVRQEGDVVQVVQWLGSGNALVTEEAIAWLTDRQSTCLDALPEPCAPAAQEELPAAIDERGASEHRAPDGQATPDAGLGSGNVLASPQFGWRVSIADDGWSITDIELFTNAEYFQLRSGRSLVTVESVIDRHGDPRQCVLDNLALLEEFEERAVIELGSDDPDERAAGIEQAHAWAIYTVEPLLDERADQEYTIRYDCYALVEGEASLVVTHTAPRELWTEEREKGQRFREGIELPESSANAEIALLAGDQRLMRRTLIMGIPRIWISLAARSRKFIPTACAADRETSSSGITYFRTHSYRIMWPRRSHIGRNRHRYQRQT